MGLEQEEHVQWRWKGHLGSWGRLHREGDFSRVLKGELESRLAGVVVTFSSVIILLPAYQPNGFLVAVSGWQVESNC